MLPIDIQILKYVLFEKHIYDRKIKPYFRWAGYQRVKHILEAYQPDSDLMDSPLLDTPFTIFDLETTGLMPQIGHEVLSIGAIQVKGLKHCRTERFYQVIRPIQPVSNHTLELTGLTRQSIKNASPFIDGFQKFLEFSKDSILVAHPANFDMGFLQTMLKRWKLPKYQPFVIDSQKIAKWLLPDVNHTLDALLHYFEIEQMIRHHALNDAIMTAELFENLLKELNKKEITTYRELCEKIDCDS